MIYPRFSQNNIIGPIRLRGLAKYLPEFGWEATILTLKSNEGFQSPFKVIELDCNCTNSRLSKYIIKNFKTNPNLYNHSSQYQKLSSSIILKFVKDMFFHSGYDKSWYKPAVEEGTKILKEEQFDAILSSSPPVSSHLAAKNLKDKFKIPWIADFRDLWTQNPYTNYFFIREYFERKLEIKTLKNADAITTTSSHASEDLKILHRREEVYPVLNGFDTDQNMKNIRLSDKLNIAYTGSLYNGKRNPKLLFKAMNELNIENSVELSDFSIEFYGPIEGWVKEEIEKYGLGNIVKLHGVVSRDDILRIQRETQILLLLSWNNPKEKGIIPGKIYEYLAAGRPILSIGPPQGPVKDLIESTNAGIHLSDYYSVKNSIKNLYAEFKINGKIQYNGIPEEVNKYSQEKMAKKFAFILDEISAL